MYAHAGGMCMSQCKHWRIPLSYFPVPRKGKYDACKSFLLPPIRADRGPRYEKVPAFQIEPAPWICYP